AESARCRALRFARQLGYGFAGEQRAHRDFVPCPRIEQPGERNADPLRAEVEQGLFNGVPGRRRGRQRIERCALELIETFGERLGAVHRRGFASAEESAVSREDHESIAMLDDPARGPQRTRQAEPVGLDLEIREHAGGHHRQSSAASKSAKASCNRAVSPRAGLSAAPSPRRTRRRGEIASSRARSGHGRPPSAMARPNANVSSTTYSMRVARAPIFTASVFLPTFASVARSRRLFTTRMAVESAPIAAPAAQACGGTSRACA